MKAQKPGGRRWMLSTALPQVHPRVSDTLWDLFTPGRIKLIFSLCQGLFFLAVTMH